MQMSHPFPKQRGEFAHVPCRTIFERLIPITGPRIVGSVRTTDGLGAGAPCRVLPLFTEPGPRIHAGAEIAIDKFQADDSPDQSISDNAIRRPFCPGQGRLLSSRPFSNV
jgi:hypothetical protein